MKRFQQNIRKVVPYVPGDQPDFPDMIKLNTNENPYPPAPEVQEVLAKSNAEQMRLYPDPTAHQLNAAIAEAYGVEEAQVFTGVGSDDVLAMIFQTFFNSDLPILFPDITYAFYPVWCDLFRIPTRCSPEREAGDRAGGLLQAQRRHCVPESQRPHRHRSALCGN